MQIRNNFILFIVVLLLLLLLPCRTLYCTCCFRIAYCRQLLLLLLFCTHLRTFRTAKNNLSPAYGFDAFALGQHSNNLSAWMHHSLAYIYASTNKPFKSNNFGFYWFHFCVEQTISMFSTQRSVRLFCTRAMILLKKKREKSNRAVRWMMAIPFKYAKHINTTKTIINIGE